MEHETTLHTWLEACTWLFLLMPLASASLCIMMPKRYAWMVTFIACLLLLVSATSACFVSLTLIKSNAFLVIPVNWFSVGSYQLAAGIRLDSITLIMLPVITIISLLVHIYSTGYMAGDKNLTRYFAMLGFFTFAMLGLVVADNLLLVFVFWELVGFSSYMLIGHWMEKPSAAAAAKKAFLFNRIGDAGFLIGIMLIWSHTSSLELTTLVGNNTFYSWQTAASLCLFCGVMGKSAQFPLLTWLPDAMEGPTPASALIHAATMVAAGVYLLVKLISFFTPAALEVVISIGALTTLMASLSALFQTDLKKILAYSTLSQLGFMIIAIGSGAEDSAMMHLFTHAFFKAGLFLAAGSVIHAMHQVEHRTHHHFDVQDLRNLGGLRKHLPVTFIIFVVCGAALSGMPLFSGFLSKDAILTSVWVWKGNDFSWKWLVMIITFAIPFLTALYTFRMIWFVFFGENKTADMIGQPIAIDEVPVIMRLPMIILTAASCWLMLSYNPFDFSGWLYHYLHRGEEFHLVYITIFSAAWVLLAQAVAYFYFRHRTVALGQSGMGKFLLHSFYLDALYHVVITKPVEKLSALTIQIDVRVIDGLIHAGAYAQVTFAHGMNWFDKYIIDGLVHGVMRLVRTVGSLTRSFQGGKIQLYIFWAVLGIIILLLSMSV